MVLPSNVSVFSSTAELFQASAQTFAELAKTAVAAHGSFSVALSGGSTPKGLFSVLADSPALNVPWQNVLFFWGDERHVPPDHADSNFRMTQESLLSKVPVRAENVHRIKSEWSHADAAARDYEQELRSVFSLGDQAFPRFDLVLLGMGADGHTASLFPGTQALTETRRLVVANWVEKLKTFRITFTFPVINAAAWVMFLAAGADKAEAIGRVFGNSNDGPPAKMVRPVDGRLVWLLDRSAAGTAAVV